MQLSMDHRTAVREMQSLFLALTEGIEVIQKKEITLREFHMAWWLAGFMNLYTRSGWLRSLASEQSSL